jgi:phosphoglycerate kinase
MSLDTPGLKGIKFIDEFDLKEKQVFIRVDFNVPLNEKATGSEITDDTRIRAALPTIRYALEKGAKIVLASHLGRPEGGPDDRKKFSMEPVARRLGELLDAEVILIDEPNSDAPKGLLPTLRPNQVLLLENLRFEKGETKNARDFALQMASYTDIYIDDAFGACHRAHASIHALPEAVEKKGVGFLIKKEIELLDVLLHKPQLPYAAILGGSKVSDKIPVIENMLEKVDCFLIGGAMSYTFLAAKNLPVGNSRVEKDKVSFAREMIARIEARGKKILLPVDHVVANDFSKPTDVRTTDTVAIPDGYMALDIGPKTSELYRKELAKMKTIFWNGPMGVFERPQFARGSFKIAEALAGLTETGTMTIVGGGDSAAAAEASGFADKMTHISTGGGASLEYLQGDKLPGLEILRNLRPSVSPTL